ncbi:MAG: UDP-N-acetylmuramoyl-tripeptide--D-alanyl-D-alanine ligase [Bacteroidota bacterium]
MPYSTDTRTLEPGDTYVAIRGETHDGHTFVPQAIERGAAGVVAERDVKLPDGVELTRVEDSVDWLVGQATEKVQRLGPDIVAITGSMGKTTTRTAVAAVLGETFEVVASEGNKNTPLGLSLLIVNRDITPATKLVLEMGARLEGDLRELCTYFPPAVSVVTVVRGVHVETLGSIEGVQREKSELVRALGPGGTACLNGDDPRVLQMAEVNAGRTVTYGTGPDCDLRPDRITAELPILGEHAALTALAAFGVGLAFGMDDAAINRGLAKIEPEKGRLNRLRGLGGSTLIDDTYNASPDATLAALRVLETQDGTRRIAFLGDMLELGETEVEEHARVLAAAVRAADQVHAVGKIMAQAAETLPEAQRERVTLHPASSGVAEVLRSGGLLQPQAGDVLLVKGSQGTRMERISEALLHPDLDPAGALPRQSESWKQIA